MKPAKIDSETVFTLKLDEEQAVALAIMVNAYVNSFPDTKFKQFATHIVNNLKDWE